MYALPPNSTSPTDIEMHDSSPVGENVLQQQQQPVHVAVVEAHECCHLCDDVGVEERTVFLTACAKCCHPCDVGVKETAVLTARAPRRATAQWPRAPNKISSPKAC